MLIVSQSVYIVMVSVLEMCAVHEYIHVHVG